MRIDTRATIKNYDGKDLTDEKQKPLTLRDVFAIALNAQLPNETIPAEQKAKIYGLSVKLYQQHDVNLTVDEAALIKERVGQVYGPLIFGRVSDVLDRPEKEEKGAE